MPVPWQEDIVMQHAKELGYNEAWSTPWFFRTANQKKQRNYYLARKERKDGANGKKERGFPPIPTPVKRPYRSQSLLERAKQCPFQRTRLRARITEEKGRNERKERVLCFQV